MKTKADIIIGIDPDVSRSGVAQLDVAGRGVELFSLPFPELIEYLRRMGDCGMRTGRRIVVVVEASWKISANWHTTRGDNARMAARKGKDSGRCHEVGRKIVECAVFYGLQIVEQLPLKKIWNGKDGKITHAEMAQFMRIPGRSNQEERDAALLAWNEAGFPIRLARPLKGK